MTFYFSTFYIFLALKSSSLGNSAPLIHSTRLSLRACT